MWKFDYPPLLKKLLKSIRRWHEIRKCHTDPDIHYDLALCLNAYSDKYRKKMSFEKLEKAAALGSVKAHISLYIIYSMAACIVKKRHPEHQNFIKHAEFHKKSANIKEDEDEEVQREFRNWGYSFETFWHHQYVHNKMPVTLKSIKRNNPSLWGLTNNRFSEDWE